ncbi:MAG: efflux RND transporter permease subunit [Proteobacteria bacterium]|nr:efflux RND transporter permease subunit [Pseudomonadota bacterium]
MIRFFIKHPVTTVMFVLFWVVLGITSWPRMNVETTPPIDLPMITATFIYPGASPDEIESQVIKRAEDAISEVAGVKKITSQAFENGGMVMAEFNLGLNVNDKAAEVKAKIDAIGDFPDALKKPVVEKLNPLQQPVMDIVLLGANVRDLQQFARDELSQRITALPGVASVSVYGGEQRAVRIFMDPERLAARGMAVTDVVSALAAQNLNVPGGRLDTGEDSAAVRFVGEFGSVDDIKNLLITTGEGGRFKLSDIAKVSDAARDKDTGARFNGRDVVIVSVVKATDGNAIRVSRALRAAMPGFESAMKDYFNNASSRVGRAPDSPAADTPSMQIISDSSTAIQHETDGTVRDIALGLILCVITLLIFTRNWRTTVIAGVMIPASLLSGFFFMDAFGFSINAMTLLAMATALGTLITDAIVLIESALGLVESGMDPEDAAVEGTKKVMVRIFATIATHVVVFLPLAFMGGIAGMFMKQFGLSVVFLVLLSSMFSFTLTPMMIAKILRKRQNRDAKRVTRNANNSNSRHASRVTRHAPLSWFRPFYDWQVRRPWSAVGVALIALVVTLIPMRWVGNEFAAARDTDEINITARAPMGSTFQKSLGIAKEIEKRLGGFPEVKFTSVKIGERGLQNIGVRVGLAPRLARSESDKRIAQRMVSALYGIPDTEINVRAGASISGVMSADLVLNISGPDDAKREAYAARAIAAINQIPEVQSATLASQTPGAELRFIPNPDAMKYWGVANMAAGAVLRTAVFGNDDYKYRESGKEYPIVLEMSPDYKSRGMFENIFIGTPKGLVALSDLGTIEQARGTPEIRRINKERITEIDINLGKSTIGPVQQKIQAQLDKIDMSPGYGTSFGGMSEMQSESTGEMGRAFLLATILTFMVLAAILNSLAHPFTIVTSIITSFTGVFLMLFLTGATINIAAMLSVVMLVGLAVSTNILVLEPTLEEMGRGVPARQALWNQFVDKRRMLYMTTVAVVAGLVPQLWSPDGIKVSMGAVIIGGILASLFWTFFLTPAVFTLMERMRHPRK